MTDKQNKAVNTCRLWLQGKLYPNTSRGEFLSLLIGIYRLTDQDAFCAMADAEWAEQFKDQPEIAGIASI